MYKKVNSRRRKATKRRKAKKDNPLPEKMEATGNDIRLIRPKSRFSTAKQAWADIVDKHGFNSNQVKPKHTKKAWRWIHK